MHYVVYEANTGSISQVSKRKPDDDQIPEGFICGEFDNVLEPLPKKHCIDLATLKIIEKPDAPVVQVQASWVNIKMLRTEFSELPIQTSYGLFDADNQSISNLEAAFDYWYSLTTKEQNSLVWKMADNSKQSFTRTQLRLATRKLLEQKAIRSARLHAAAEIINSMDPKPTQLDIASIDYWLNLVP